MIGRKAWELINQFMARIDTLDGSSAFQSGCSTMSCMNSFPARLRADDDDGGKWMASMFQRAGIVFLLLLLPLILSCARGRMKLLLPTGRSVHHQDWQKEETRNGPGLVRQGQMDSISTRRDPNAGEIALQWGRRRVGGLLALWETHSDRLAASQQASTTSLLCR